MCSGDLNSSAILTQETSSSVCFSPVPGQGLQAAGTWHRWEFQPMLATDSTPEYPRMVCLSHQNMPTLPNSTGCYVEEDGPPWSQLLCTGCNGRAAPRTFQEDVFPDKSKVWKYSSTKLGFSLCLYLIVYAIRCEFFLFFFLSLLNGCQWGADTFFSSSQMKSSEFTKSKNTRLPLGSVVLQKDRAIDFPRSVK